MTNIERIRNMSDKELRDYIFDLTEGIADCTNCKENCDFCELTERECKEKMMNWLYEESEE